MNRPRHRRFGFATWLGLGVGLELAVSGSGCSSGGPLAMGSGGSPIGSGGTAGGAASSGGKAGAGGKTGAGGTTSSGGTTGIGGLAGGGGSKASGGTTGAAGGAGQGGGGRNGGSGAGGSTGRGGSTIPSTITLTSPVLVEGGMFAADNTCADPGMGSPELDWTPGPSGTMSYAVTLTDLTAGLIYWAIWNIPIPSGAPTKITLPAKLDTIAMLTTPAGAIQINRVNSRGYYGPCLVGETDTFQFQVYAIPVASLAGMTNSTDAASASMRAVATATGTLSATSNAHH